MSKKSVKPVRLAVEASWPQRGASLLHRSTVPGSGPQGGPTLVKCNCFKMVFNRNTANVMGADQQTWKCFQQARRKTPLGGLGGHGFASAVSCLRFQDLLSPEITSLELPPTWSESSVICPPVSRHFSLSFVTSFAVDVRTKICESVD